jgi:four helix bundle protein
VQRRKEKDERTKENGKSLKCKQPVLESNDLSKRLFEFAIGVIGFLRTLPNDAEYKVIKYQLIKSATSTGANYEESQGASSKPDFHNKVNISLREIKESNYWLRLLERIIDFHYNENELKFLIDESNQLSKILGKISAKTKKL